MFQRRPGGRRPGGFMFQMRPGGRRPEGFMFQRRPGGGRPGASCSKGDLEEDAPGLHVPKET